MTEKTTIDDLIFEIECMAPAGETNGIPYLRLGKADLLHKLNAIKGQSDHQPTFAVGEYYADDHGRIVRIDKITIGHITASKLCDGQITQTVFTFWLAQDVLKPAIAEQIATFKRAEHFASKGRKLDELEVGDRINCCDIPLDNGYYTWDLTLYEINGATFTAMTDHGALYLYRLNNLNKVTLIQTAEELQEVGE